MEKSLEALRKDLSRVRTGRASLALLDGVRVELLRGPDPLAQVASLSVPESRTIIDPALGLQDDRGNRKGHPKIRPGPERRLNDGKIVRINIPPLTEERRKELVKVTKRMEEECKVALRNIRRDANEQLKTAKKDKVVSEDEQFKLAGRSPETHRQIHRKGRRDHQGQRKGDPGDLSSFPVQDSYLIDKPRPLPIPNSPPAATSIPGSPMFFGPGNLFDRVLGF